MQNQDNTLSEIMALLKEKNLNLSEADVLKIGIAFSSKEKGLELFRKYLRRGRRLNAIDVFFGLYVAECNLVNSFWSFLQGDENDE